MRESSSAVSGSTLGHSKVPISPLCRDTGCGNRLNWRCDVSGTPSPSDVENRFVASGYRSMCSHPSLKVLRHPEGHEVAWVIRTGRIQIRVGTWIDEAQRRATADTLYLELCRRLGRSATEDRSPVPRVQHRSRR